MESPKATTEDLQGFLKSMNKYLLKRGNVLDIGCNEGKTLIWSEELDFKRLVGIDLESYNYGSMYCNVIRRFSEHKKLPFDFFTTYKHFQEFYTFIQDDVFKYDFKGEQFDCVMSLHLLHLLPFENQLSLLELIYSLMHSESIAYIKFNSIGAIVKQNPDYYTFKKPNIIEGNFDKKVMYLNTEPELYALINKLSWNILDTSIEDGVYRFILKKK